MQGLVVAAECPAVTIADPALPPLMLSPLSMHLEAPHRGDLIPSPILNVINKERRSRKGELAGSGDGTWLDNSLMRQNAAKDAEPTYPKSETAVEKNRKNVAQIGQSRPGRADSSHLGLGLQVQKPFFFLFHFQISH